MSKLAFLFPGQGSQKTGMGKASAERFAEAREVFERADRALGFPLSKLCFEGPDEELQLTENTQPAILAVSVALTRVLASRGLEPDFVAGHSLGEYSALVSVNSLRLEDALTLVRKRGRYMQEAVPVGMGAMAAIVGLSSEAVKEVCEEVAGEQVVEPANFNGGGQVVIAGHREAVDRASALAREKGARRAIPLPVSAPFHCRLMRPAAKRLANDLGEVTFNDASVPLVNNVDATPIRKGEDARDGLERQVASPVRWEESIERLLREGVGRFVEVGPGKVLTGLVRKISRQTQTVSVEDVGGVEKALEEMCT
jgi:[acyl-carrier-protein] S-malonyltransferase